MYPFLFIIFIILLLFVILNYCHRRKIIKKICCMDCETKCNILNNLLEPFGYSYLLSQDIFTSRIDAWQKEFGYTALYDKTAYRFGMVFDCIPIYFDYNNKTWLIEVWKGQYGINTGAETGIYYADKILSKEDYHSAIFKPASNYEMPVFSFHLYKNNALISNISGHHWWLTSFTLGMFSNPQSLKMRISVTFKDKNMCYAFAQGLIDTGYNPNDINVLRDTVIFLFDSSSKITSRYKRFRIKLTQSANRFWCSIFLKVTKPFTSSLDRCLYLYYHIPFAFRRTLRIKRFRKRRGA